jgi:hypothetical protein
MSSYFQDRDRYQRSALRCLRLSLRRGRRPANTYGSLPWGYRYDVPLPNVEFDGDNNTREVAVFRPTNSTLNWSTTTGSASGSIQVSFYYPHFVHMHGLYDDDSKTDIAVYNPNVGGVPYFILMLSSTGWTSSIQRWFDVALSPNAIAASSAGSNAAAVRHGGIPLEAQKLVNLGGRYKSRRVLRVWDAWTASFYTMWNPTTSASIEGPCQWGEPRDVPLAGPVDRDGDGRTDLAVYRPEGNSNGPRIFMRAGSGCGSGTSILLSGMTSKMRVWAVTDMNGDAKGDYLLLEPDKYEWHLYLSAASGTYTHTGPYYLGGPGSIPL